MQASRPAKGFHPDETRSDNSGSNPGRYKAPASQTVRGPDCLRYRYNERDDTSRGHCKRRLWMNIRKWRNWDRLPLSPLGYAGEPVLQNFLHCLVLFGT